MRRPTLPSLAWAVAALAALLAPLVANERQVFLLMSILVLAVFSTSFNVLLGYTGLVSFAHAAYYGVGAYTVALVALHLGWSPLLGFVLAPVTTALVAYASGLIALRATRLYFALLTLALGQLLFLIAFQWRSMTRGDDGIHGIVLPPALASTTPRYYFILGAAALALTVLAVVMRSPFGQTLRAIRENRERTGFLGVKVKRYELASFTIGGTFAGYAGGMYAIYNRQAFPELMHWTTSAEPIFVTLIGGLSSFAGPTVGAVVFGLLRDVITRNLEYWQAVLGVVLLLIILFLPGGLVEGVKRIGQLVLGGRGTPPPTAASTSSPSGPADRDAETTGTTGGA
ncbi:MAG: branched-chain amino acid ABC transporter permease [Actinobacteria bacterium]|nr:branched-chain amino acid ABC transporter permease [Actinomycetota bacterium]